MDIMRMRYTDNSEALDGYDFKTELITSINLKIIIKWKYWTSRTNEVVKLNCDNTGGQKSSKISLLKRKNTSLEKILVTNYNFVRLIPFADCFYLAGSTRSMQKNEAFLKFM